MHCIVSKVSARALALGAALFAIATLPAAAQYVPRDEEPVDVKRPRGFNLLGLGDFALTGMRGAGNTIWFTTNAGPANTFQFYTGWGPGRVRGTTFSPTGFIGGFFEIQLWMTAGRGDWSRARDNIPSLEKVKGGGYNARTNLQRFAPPDLWAFQARDGSVGTLHSGTTSEEGTGSCLDNSSNFNAATPGGVALLAASDCPATWPNGVFSPERPVPDTVFLRRFRANPANFTFDDWGIPASERADKLYGSFQTYGVTSDFGREALRLLGEVVPPPLGVAGPHQLEGYSMGIEWAFQAFTYAVPTVADAMFYKVTIVNKSADVYGAGIDYDSLYLGVMARPFYAPQSPAVYAVPSRGAVFSTNNNVNGTNCYGAQPGGKTLGTAIRPCNENTVAGRGFNRGAGGVIFLKSPIGDLRNKKFTDPASPFFSPSHPEADDTLTFDHNDGCGFSCMQRQMTTGNVRAAFGALAEVESEALGGRGQSSSELSQTEYFDLFHTEDWPTRWNPAVRNVGGFNKYVPGNWDWNDDGLQDTLHVTSCGRSGCVTPWSDTLPGGFPNTLHNAFHMGSGPIKLKAGDTTSFVMAFLSSPDSVSFESSVNNIITLYQNFWLSPEPPCPARIISAVPTGGNRQFNTNVRLNFDQSVNDCQDRFLIEQAKSLRASPVASDIRLRVLNPGLVADILARALPVGTIIEDTVPKSTAFNSLCGRGQILNTTNCTVVKRTALGVVDSLFIFKSCDGGQTFTASAGAACIPAPSRDVSGAANAFAFQAYAKLGRDARGRFPAFYNDGGVTAGLTYTYVVVGASFPATFTLVDSVGTGAARTLGVTTFSVRPRVVNSISTNTANTNVANVYVPASAPGGGTATAVNLTTTESDTIGQFSVSSRLLKPLKGTVPVVGSIIIADSAEVQIFDSDTTVAGISSTTLRLYALQDTAPTGTTVRRAATEIAVFTVSEPRSSLVVLGDSIVRKDSAGAGTSKYSFVRYNSRGPKAALIAGGRPVYVTDSLPTSDITPAGALSRADFPGLQFGIDVSQQARFRGISWSLPGLGVLQPEAYPNVTWLTDPDIAKVRDDRAYSHYQFTFIDKEYGPQSPFRLNREVPTALQPVVTASLAARKTASTTVTDSAAVRAVNKALGITNLTADSLATLKLPFTVVNKSTGGAVSIAVLKREHPISAVFGTGVDTIAIALPSDAWVPGDRLYFIETFTTDSTVRVGTRTVVVQNTVEIQNNAGLVDTVVVPVKTTTTRVTWGPAVVACQSPQTCNPIEGIGGSGYTAIAPNEKLDVVYFAPIRGLVTFNFQIDPEQTGQRVVNAARDLKLVRVVPNPYVMFSQYEQTRNSKQLLFTHLPPTGTIRIYTASGQFVQQINFRESDLEQNCRATTSTTECEATGDLKWNMRTRENLDIGPGFYVFVVSTTTAGKFSQKLGKFVIIQ